MNEHARLLLLYLNQILLGRDRGEKVPSFRRFRMAPGLWLPVALSVVVTSCASETEEGTASECDGGNCATLCADGLDNDEDGRVDCGDGECAGLDLCQLVRYGVPLESDCADGLDDDADGMVDCADQDCASNCEVAIYAIPLGVEED